MSTNIKSDRISSMSIGNIYNIKSELDFMFMLDFNSDNYLIKDGVSYKRLDLSDAVTNTRNSKAEYRDKTGEVRVADVDIPRLHYMPNHRLQGLLLESASTNLLSNPNNPQTQTITLNAIAGYGVALSVKGSGSAVISGTGVVSSSTAATESNPVGVSLVAGTNKSVTVTVTGDLTYFQLESMSATTYGVSATTFIQGNGARAQDTAIVKDELATTLKDAQTVVMQVVLDNRLTDDYGALLDIFRLIGVQPEAGTMTVTIENRTEGVFKLRAKSTATATSAARLDGMNITMSNNKATIVLYYDRGGVNAKFGANGEVATLKGQGSVVNFNELKLLPINGIVTRLAAFDYKVTDEQAVLLSSSWN